MTPKLKWGLIALAVIVATLAVRTMISEHDARVKAEATQEAQQRVIADAQKQIDAAKVDQAKAAADLNVRLAAIEAQKRQPVTAPQFIVDASKLIPNLPKPLEVVQPPPTQQVVNGKPETVPSAPMVQIPAEDLQAFRDYKLSCDETGARLQACSITTAAMTEQTTAMKSQEDALTKERDSWKIAAKGGTFWHRTLTAAKWVAIGAAAGYAAGRSTH